MHCWLINEMMFFFSRATPTPAAASTTSASGSCVMERLSTTAVSHLHSEETVETSSTGQAEQIEHFAEQLVGHMAKQQQQSGDQVNVGSNSSDQAFHPITTEGLQVCFGIFEKHFDYF